MDRNVRIARMREAVKILLNGKEMTVREMADSPEISSLKYSPENLRQRLLFLEKIDKVTQHKRADGAVVWTLASQESGPVRVNGKASSVMGFTLKGRAITFEEAREIWEVLNPIFSRLDGR